ncbi:MAG: cysteine-rich CWC family protein [Zoogloeaceae bacterium]|nr:cysteine-rich CWC family protein [Zoogloeaceae bacterium]
MEADENKSVCAGCGGMFTCGAAAGLPRCWCQTLPPLQAPPPDGGKTCYCPACLNKLLAGERLTSA